MLLQSILPTKEEVQLVCLYQGDSTKLGKAEVFQFFFFFKFFFSKKFTSRK